MADSDVEDGSDVSDTDDQPVLDLSNLTEKERKKWESSLSKWRLFLDFLFRHISIVTYKYNCFEREELLPFMMALEKAEALRGQQKLKKGQVPRVINVRTMKEATELLFKNNYIVEANRIRKFIDLVGRMRSLGTIATGFYKALKKGKVNGLDNIKHYLDFWKGFCVRSYDFTQLELANVDPLKLNDLEQKYLAWPAMLRTTLNLSERFLKKTCDSTGMKLCSDDPDSMKRHMQAAEFVLAAKIDMLLFQKVVQDSQKFGALKGLNPTPSINQMSNDTTSWQLPPTDGTDPLLLQPIPDNGILLELPPDPPKEKKKKKGKKGKKGGRGFSAKSHKGRRRNKTLFRRK